MNPQTGEILAMVSLPTYDNDKFAAGISAADYAAYLNDPTSRCATTRSRTSTRPDRPSSW
jgi:cell division protein FtsI/penicillin-binding protein 2